MRIHDSILYRARNQNFIFLGTPVLGKTHIASSIALEAISKGYKTYFMTVQELVTSLETADNLGN
ncbi:hypothetical protein EQV77_09140 [Halobacillus fulvus]|nr:hypothetical protein EQV77_09140 [Halobacillus fulvus]